MITVNCGSTPFEFFLAGPKKRDKSGISPSSVMELIPFLGPGLFEELAPRVQILALGLFGRQPLTPKLPVSLLHLDLVSNEIPVSFLYLHLVLNESFPSLSQASLLIAQFLLFCDNLLNAAVLLPNADPECGDTELQERLGPTGHPDQTGYRCAACGRLYPIPIDSAHELTPMHNDLLEIFARLESLKAKAQPG